MNLKENGNINLPKGFPMYCRDLKQMLDEKADSMTTEEISKVVHTDKVSHNVYSSWDSRVLKYSKSRLLMKAKDYSHPELLQTNEHNALSDARWNKKLFNFITNL